MTEKLQLSRAGLLNFWYYDNEIYDFADGKLLLRGSNGSGKSVTMQSLITVLLDGRKGPDRLDPFGSKARRMEDYLLGEPGVREENERTGYLWLEYIRPGSQRTITTGIGLKAKRNSPLDFWGFVITDNRRIGKNFALHKTEYSPEEGKDVIVPLSRKELTNRLEQGGRVVQGQREYMELVNRHVFGFDSLEAYEDLIKLMIQLRSPKLSKDFKPTVIYEILNESLPPLADDELRPLSETIENMDQIRQQLEQLQRDQRSLKRLARDYEAYNRYHLAEKAKGTVDAAAGKEKLIKDRGALTNELLQKEQNLEQAQEKKQNLTEEQQVLTQEDKELQDHEVHKAQSQKHKAENDKSLAQTARSHKENQLTEKQRRERRLEEEICTQQTNLDQLSTKQYTILETMEAHAQDASFAPHPELAKDFLRRQTDYEFSLWLKETQDYTSRLDQIIQAANQVTAAQEKYTQADHDHAQASQALDTNLKALQRLEEELDQAKEEYIEVFHQWSKNNTQLHLTSEEAHQVIHRLMDIFQGYKPEAVLQPITQAYNTRAQAIAQEIAQVTAAISNKQEQISIKKQEIQEWKNQTDPEPDRHKDTTQARAKLTAAQIPWLPLYAAVEFKEQVPQEERERLEAAITQAGLLDALIVPTQHLTSFKSHDKVILPNPHLMEYTLADLLEPVPGNQISSQEIGDVLASILVDTPSLEQGQISVDTKGNFRIALISGQAPREKAKYIGREARRRFRQQRISELEGELDSLNLQLNNITQELEQATQRKLILQEEYANTPPLTPLENINHEMQKQETQFKIHQKDQQTKHALLEQAHQKLLNARRLLQTLSRELNLPEDEESYRQAKKTIEMYTTQLNELRITYTNLCNTQANIAKQQEYLQETQQEVDTLKGELNTIDSQLRMLNLQIQQLNFRLQELGAEAIQQRIQEVQQRIQALPKELEDINAFILNTQRDLQDGKVQSQTLASRLSLAERMEQCWQQLLHQELRYSETEPQDIAATAKALTKELGSILQQTDREKVYNRLSQTFYQEQLNLLEYRPSLSGLTLETEIPELDQEEWGKGDLKDLKQAKSRHKLVLDYGGRHTSPQAVLTQMDQDITVQELLLSEKDRELYEEIILHSVGDIIRKRISRAKQWVSKINTLMEQRNTSSGLTFSLHWKPKTAEQEEELDTEELVSLLMKDPNLLKEQDMQAIARHFRAKIDRAKAELEDRQKGDTFHTIVRELLDYRKWFAFQLFFKKEHELKKELTDKVFFTFSGGEKAMAMYIPLFSAAYSRYQEARSDAPHIISLDEAFAGVDETNIRDMFDLMEQLGFNYIINSQALWGDYDTANKLAIAELVRPKNAPYVTVIRYYWDGQVRHLQSKAEVAVTD
jgi:uncharacterized protein (TIGR02680 family)